MGMPQCSSLDTIMFSRDVRQNKMSYHEPKLAVSIDRSMQVVNAEI